MRNETTGGEPLPVYDNRATSTAVASPVQGAASMADLVQSKQGEPARRIVELTQGAASSEARERCTECGLSCKPGNCIYAATSSASGACATCGGSKVDPGGLPICRDCGACAEEVETARLAAAHYGRPESDIPALVAFERHRVEQSKVPGMPGLSGAIPNFIAGYRAALADRSPAVQPVAAEQALQQIQHKLKVMLASATALGEGEWVEGYQIKTSALHGILGIMAGAGYAVTIPLPERAVAEFQEAMRAEVIPEVIGVLQERTDAARATEHLPLSATPAPEQEAAQADSFAQKVDADTYRWALKLAQERGFESVAAAVRAAQVAPPGAQEAAYRVYEFWSSSTPGTKVRMLAEGEDIEAWAKRGDFIRDVTAPVPAATPAEQPEGYVMPPTRGTGSLLNADELAALRRFDECAQDGEGYDVPKEMMQRLAEIGVVRRKSGAYYEATDFGQHVLGNAPTVEASTPDALTMARRFLGWKVPADFSPDSGISFKPYDMPHMWPIGTNLFNEDQATAMFNYCLQARATATNTNQPEGEKGGAPSWKPVTSAGQVRPGDRLRFTIGDKLYKERAKQILHAGTDKEEVIYNKAQNFYFITSMVLSGFSSHKNVEYLEPGNLGAANTNKGGE